MTEKINVSLIFVDAQGRTHQQSFSVVVGTNIRKLLELSGWFAPVLVDELQVIATWLEHTLDNQTPNHKQWHIGVFSQKKPLNYLLQAGDRVEIYRLLKFNPMVRRKNKAKAIKP